MSRTDLADAALLAGLEDAAPHCVSTRAIDRLAMAHDASHYLLTPRAVVTPTSAEQVARLLRGAASSGVPLTFRSGGTSLSGQAGTDQVLVDTRRHFRDIEVLDGGRRVRTGPGATIRQVNQRLARFGFKLGPDPASEIACTVGGVIANNSSGMACGTEFNTYRTLESAVLVLPSGTTIDTGRADSDRQLAALEPELYAGLVRLRDRVRADPASVRTLRQQFSMKNTLGYGLNAFLDHHDPVDLLLHLVVGSEGTLAFVADAVWRTVAVKPVPATGLLVFPDLFAATAALPDLVAAGFATIELMDATSLRVGQRDPAAAPVLKSLAVRDHAALLVEFQEMSLEAISARTTSVAALLAELPLTVPAELSADPAVRAGLWHIRKGLYATVAGNRPPGTTALLEDIAVPIAALGATCQELTGLFDRHGYSDSVIFGHAKDGNIHFLINERLDRSEMLDRYVDFTQDLVELVLGRHGTLKAEHGTGRIMAPFVRRQYGDELYEVMLEVKRLCDPAGLLNPGAVLTDDPLSYVSHLKVAPPVEEEVDRCVECGYCEPVCPSKDLTLTPRKRIVLRRELARAEQAGEADLVAELERDYQYDGVDTCAVDGMCQTSCPVLIDTGQLVKRLRSEQRNRAEQAGWNLAARHWGRVTRGASGALSAAQRVPAVVAGASRVGRKILGPDTVPLWQKDIPSGGPRRRPVVAPHPDAVYFAACIGSMFGVGQESPGVSLAFVTLARRAGVTVATPEGIGSLCCGTPWKSKGLSDGYATMAGQVLPALHAASAGGRIPIVSDASSCTEGLRQMIGSSADSRYADLEVVDSITFARNEFLPRLRVGAKLGSVAIHPTCSSTRLHLDGALRTIAEAIADDVLVPDAWGCCAFAGDRGMLHPQLTASATRAEAAEISQRTFTAYASTNRTCEMGMSRATGRSYRHILELLEEATR
ncbi:D-lactate dehydrogenase [Nakamurella panacisegetis]|uniref:D-lactate dehydrogenase (cytochrome) n=1 Tax=Nakamurella panacisegetis TaxID=1090615 RepID=A0A1H0SW24_9ACTN|nr:FAD-binding and (Fe-S)-binding domain-containing protein [Nakamurella panacisegetis]SDP45506.1 D-lactate dehydrogenase [Nakamurella panacisegetis]